MGYPSRVPPEMWAAARRDYEAGTASQVELAKRLGLSRATINERIRRKAWGVTPAEPMTLAEMEAAMARLTAGIMNGLESLAARGRALDHDIRTLPASEAIEKRIVHQERCEGSAARLLKMTREATQLLDRAARTMAAEREAAREDKESYEDFQLRFLGQLERDGQADLVGRLKSAGQAEADALLAVSRARGPAAAGG